jgi:hypothetical protein
MNHIKSLAFFVVVGILQAAPRLSAQQQVFDAAVPFQFSAGDRTLPAGEYRLSRRTAFLDIQNRNDYGAALILTTNTDSSTDGKVHLVFDQVNDQYFLRGILGPAGGIELAVSGAEKKAKMNQRHLSTTSAPTVSVPTVVSGAQ